MKKFNIILTALLCIIANSTFAGSKTFYYQATATSTNATMGLVYAAFTNTETPQSSNYAEVFTTPVHSAIATKLIGTPSSGTATLRLYAYPLQGYKFLGWAKTADATEYVSTKEESSVSVTSNKATEADPATVTYYAYFAEDPKPFFAFKDEFNLFDINGTETQNLKVDAANLTAYDITYNSSNEAVATINENGVLTIKALGTTIITAKAATDGFEATTIVTIYDAAKEGKTQIGNSDFERWTNPSLHSPDNWNSFETAEGAWVTFVKGQQVKQSTDVRPGSNGLYSAQIYSKDVSLAIAQGNLTLGCINAGATSAANKANHNFTKISDPSKSETIDAIPTAIKLWVKFQPGKENKDFPYARIAASIHDAYNYITYGQESDNTETNESHAIAHATKNFEACDWTELTIPFILTDTWKENEDQKYIIVNFSTNAIPGKGQEGDNLFIDDIELLYTPVAIKGDVNDDKHLNKTDADLIVDHYLGKDVEINTENADVNNDNKISVADANEIINK